MNPRLYEKLYGMRFLVIILILVIIALLIFAILGKPLYSPTKGPEVAPNTTNAQPTQAVAPATGATMTAISPPSSIVTAPPTPVSTSVTNIQVHPTATTEPTAELITSTSTPAPISSSAVLYVCTGYSDGWLHFREMPSMFGRVIGVLPQGGQVTFIKQADTVYPWFLIDVDGVQGYSYGDFLCTSKP